MGHKLGSDIDKQQSRISIIILYLIINISDCIILVFDKIKLALNFKKCNFSKIYYRSDDISSSFKIRKNITFEDLSSFL